MWLAWIFGALGIGVFFMSKEASASENHNGNNVPSIYDNEFKRVAALYSLDWRLIKTISYNESTIGKNSRVARGIASPSDIAGSTSSDGKSWGLMQMTIPTARQFDPGATEIKLNNPEYSINLGAKFLKYLKGKFPNDRDTVMAYNHGEGNQKRFMELVSQGKLKKTEFLAGQEYWAKYQKNFKTLFGG